MNIVHFDSELTVGDSARYEVGLVLGRSGFTENFIRQAYYEHRILRWRPQDVTDANVAAVVEGRGLIITGHLCAQEAFPAQCVIKIMTRLDGGGNGTTFIVAEGSLDDPDNESWTAKSWRFIHGNRYNRRDSDPDRPYKWRTERSVRAAGWQ